jgi:predicted nucleic acid-binding protein
LALVLDTGVLYATLDADDRYHGPCTSLLSAVRGQRIVPAPALTEVDWLCGRRSHSAFSVVLDQIDTGALVVEDLVSADYRRVAELLEAYADLKVGFVDAAVLAVVERLREPKLATLDHRHFSVMRPRHVEALELLPA